MRNYFYFLFTLIGFIFIGFFSFASENGKSSLKSVESSTKLQSFLQEVDENTEIYLNSEGILSQNEQIFLDKINEERRKIGLEDLKIDDKLENVARLKALDLTENNYFNHESEVYGSLNMMLENHEISYKFASENIAKSENIFSAINLFMNSDVHKSNILNSEFNYTGVAISKSYSGVKVFVEIFIKK